MEKEKKGQKGLLYALFAIFLALIVVLSILGNNKNHVNALEEGKFTEKDLSYLRKRAKTVDGKYTGVGKGKNLIVIQIESMQDFVINREYDGQEITPNLNKLVSEGPGLYFNNYYQLIGRGKTSDAEFVTQNSLYPSMEGYSYKIYENDTFYGLPWILRDNGYTSWAFHGYRKEFWNRNGAYPNQGFERFISEEDFEVGETIGFGMVDEDFFDQSIEYIREMDKPFHTFMITLSHHTPFEMPEKYKKINLRKEHEDTILGKYIQSAHYTDEAIGKFIEDLKREGLYDDSVICLYGDHFGIDSMDEENVKLMTDFLGYTYDFDEMMKIPLIIHLPGTDVKEEISNVGSQIDFLPTILNIMGLENEKGIMFGVDIVNSEEAFSPKQMYAVKGSYIDNEKMFVMSRDGIYDNSRAFNLKTREPVDIEECRESYERTIVELDKCQFLLENDLLGDILDGKTDFTDVEPETVDIENDDLVAVAGGKVKGIPLTNSREALDESYRQGFRMIEVDLQWTNDEELVLLHDWNESLQKLFSAEPRQYSHDEFMNLEMTNGLHQMDLEDLISWMEDHEDAYIITDIREENPKALRCINKHFPEFKSRIIPQIYDMEDFHGVKVPLYRNIILNLGLSDYTDEQIIDFMKLHKHFAVAMPEARAKGELPEKLKRLDVSTYVYVTNEEKVKEELEKNHVHGVYTEGLKP